jgi:hypothetical protein
LTEYADPDLETIAPLPRVDSGDHPEPVEQPPGRDRRRWTVLIACVVAASLITGFALTTAILNLTDSGKNSVATAPGTTSPSGGSTPGAVGPGATSPGSTPPGSTTPGSTLPPDPDEGVLAGLIVNQSDVPATYTVHHPADGINLVAPTLDLCNGRYPSEALRTARRQVYVGPTDGSSTPFSTEAVLYRAAANGAQAMRELQSVVAHCPPTLVTSPVGEPSVITHFLPPPDAAWPKTPTVDRQAYSFVSTDPQSGQSVPGIAVYLRRGRALMGLYFAQPSGAQAPIDGYTTIQQIVAVFEARMARLPENVVNR